MTMQQSPGVAEKEELAQPSTVPPSENGDDGVEPFRLPRGAIPVAVAYLDKTIDGANLYEPQISIGNGMSFSDVSGPIEAMFVKPGELIVNIVIDGEVKAMLQAVFVCVASGDESWVRYESRKR